MALSDRTAYIYIGGIDNTHYVVNIRESNMLKSNASMRLAYDTKIFNKLIDELNELINDLIVVYREHETMHRILVDKIPNTSLTVKQICENTKRLTLNINSIMKFIPNYGIYEINNNDELEVVYDSDHVYDTKCLMTGNDFKLQVVNIYNLKNKYVYVFCS